MISRADLPSIAMIALGVVLIGVAVPGLIQGEYQHEVEPVSRAEYERVATGAADDAFAYRYANLSDAGQEAFRDALESDDGTSRVTAGNRAPEFRYGDTNEEYVISYGGADYSLTATGAAQLGGIGDLVLTVVAFFGVVAVVVPGIELWRHRRRDQ